MEYTQEEMKKATSIMQSARAKKGWETLRKDPKRLAEITAKRSKAIRAALKKKKLSTAEKAT